MVLRRHRLSLVVAESLLSKGLTVALLHLSWLHQDEKPEWGEDERKSYQQTMQRAQRPSWYDSEQGLEITYWVFFKNRTV